MTQRANPSIGALLQKFNDALEASEFPESVKDGTPSLLNGGSGSFADAPKIGAADVSNGSQCAESGRR